MNRVKGVLAVAALAMLVEGAGPTAKEQFDRARELVKKNASTPAGQQYDRALAAHFERNNGPLMQKCFGSTKAPDTRSFEMVFRVSKAGKIVEALVWPETNIAACLRD